MINSVQNTKSFGSTPFDDFSKNGDYYLTRQIAKDIYKSSEENKEKKGSRVVVNFGEPIKYEDMGFTDGGKTSENKRVAKRVMEEIIRLWEECK